MTSRGRLNLPYYKKDADPRGTQVPQLQLRADSAASQPQKSAEGDTGCQVCQTVLESSMVERHVIYLDYTLEDLTKPDKENPSRKSQAQEAFLRTINCFMNESGGLIIIHANNRGLLGDFDQSIDEKLNMMIPDNSFFHDIFERFVFDGKHVCFRVKVKPPNRPASTYDFCTKVSLNKGRGDPTHGQIRELIQKVSETENQAAGLQYNIAMKLKFTEKKDVEFEMEGNGSTVPFQESLRIQAKGPGPRKSQTQTQRDASAAGEQPVSHRPHRPAELVRWYWDGKGKRLPHYITAFSKIPDGGSVYLGVSEKKDEKKFKCVGHSLGSADRTEFVSEIRDKIKRDMLWYGKCDSCKPLEIIFHKVQPDPGSRDDMCIIEIKVPYFHGVAFDTADGPSMYRWTQVMQYDEIRTEKNPAKVQIDEWLRRQLSRETCPLAKQTPAILWDQDDMTA